MTRKFTFLMTAMALILAIMGPRNVAWGQTTQTWNYEVVETSPTLFTNSPVTVNGATWSIVMGEVVGSPTTNGVPTKYSSIFGWKWGDSSSKYYKSYTLSTDYFTDKNVKSVTVNFLNNGKKTGTMTVTQGSTTIGTASKEFATTWTDLTANTTTGSGGTLSINYAVAQASYIHSITVVYEESDTPSAELVSLAISGTPTKTRYEAGESFDPAGLVVTGTYDDESHETITNGIEWLIDPETFTSTGTNVSVDVIASVGNIISEVFTVTGLTVTEHVQTYANTYTSNVELTTTGGTSASTAKVIWKNAEYDAIKCGTGSVAGKCIVTIPANTQTLHFHAAGWNGETVKLNGTFDLVADAGVSGNSPFTLQNDPETSDYFTLNPQGATSITFTATSGKRFVIFGVNAETQAAAVATPTFDPESGSYSINQTVEISCETPDVTIYYTMDGTNPTTSSSEYTEAITLTEPGTTTIKAIAVKNSESSYVGSATYIISRDQYTPEQLLAEITPTTEGIEKTVVFSNNRITGIFTTQQGYRNGIYLDIEDNEDFYVYCQNVPETWEVGGKVSGTVTGVWKKYNSTKEFCPTDYEDFQYTAPTKYNITFTTNGIAEATTILINQDDAIGTLPEPTAANIPNGYTFRGWNAGDVALTDVEPTYVTAETVPEGNMTLHAVFAIAETVEEVGQKTFVLTEADFNGTSYDANNGSHTKDGITYTSYQVMKQSDLMQWQKSAGYIYNETAMKVTSISITKTDGTFTVYEGSEEHPTETITNNESGGYTFKNESDRYFSICVGSATGKVSNITVTYEGVTSSPTYSNYCTSVTALSGNVANQTYEGAYYIKATETGEPAQINGTVTINGALGNADPTLLVIEDGAQLIHHNGNVAATFHKNITGYTANESREGYYFIAAPIANASTEGIVTTENYEFYSYDEPSHFWYNLKNEEHLTNALTLGQGYLYANKATRVISFSGTINNDQDLTVEVSASADKLTGFNLVGNPFAHNLDISNMGLHGKDGVIHSITSIYQISGDKVVATQNTAIAPCEGFFIQAPVAGTLYFAAEGNNGDTPSSVRDLKVEVKETTRSAQLLDRAYVNFSESRPMNKFYMNENSTSLYIPQNGEEFAVVMADKTTGELPVNFHAEKNGTYTITVNTENLDAEYLHLIDNMTGMDVDLLTTDSYTFEAKDTDYTSRFKLVFDVKNEASAGSDSNFAYMSDGNLVISDIEGQATLQIVDMMGRVLSTETVSGNYCKALNLKAGVYVLNLNGMTQKIVVE